MVRIATPCRLALMVVSVIACTGPVQARTMQEKLQAACAADIARMCPDKVAEADALKACMLAHRAQVGQACMALIDASE